MATRNKLDKKNKAIFTLILDRLYQDSSFQNYAQEKLPENQNQLSLQFPLQNQLQQLHESLENKDLSHYVKFLQSQVKKVSNNIEYQYHQKRQTILFLGQSTQALTVSRKKIDQQMQKAGIIRLYHPQQKKKDYQDESQSQINDVGDITIKQIKRKIQNTWELDLSDQIEKQKRKQKQLQRKRAKQLEQIQKDFEKMMKKRKTLKEQLLLKSQKSMSGENNTPKKEQKIQKIQRKNSSKGRRSNPQSSVRQSVSIMNDQPQDQFGQEVLMPENQIKYQENSQHQNQVAQQYPQKTGIDVNKLLQPQSYDQNGWNNGLINSVDHRDQEEINVIDKN